MVLAEAAAAGGKIGCVIRENGRGRGQEAEDRHQQRCEDAPHVRILHLSGGIFQEILLEAWEGKTEGKTGGLRRTGPLCRILHWVRRAIPKQAGKGLVMKKLMLWASALAAVCGNMAQAQNIAGTWQGTLSMGPRNLRLVFKVALVDDKLQATAYSIDQPAPPIPVSAISRDGSTVKMTIAAIGGSFEGKLSGDGNSITGTFTQGAPVALTLTRATPETAWTIPDPPPPPKIMAADAKPVFEVATIKPSKAEEGFRLLVNPSGVLTTAGTSVTDLIKFAYDLHPRQITGGPSWMESERFDVTGKPDVGGMPSMAQLRSMLQKLLADRFGLAFHNEKKELSVYAITVLKTGIKMTKDDSNPTGLPAFGMGAQSLNIRNATMAEVATVLQSGLLDQPVVDQTGLGGTRYDFMVKFTRDPSQAPVGAPAPNAAAPGDPDAPPDIFTAFQQQLGLKLESTKAEVEVMVIDSGEKTPTEN